MSDYFLQLAARVLCPEGNIRPRVASAFEALSNDAALDETGASVTTTDTTPRVRDVAAHTASTVERRASQVLESHVADREIAGGTIQASSSRAPHSWPPAMSSLVSRSGEWSAPISELNHQPASVRDVRVRGSEMSDDSPRARGHEMRSIPFTVDAPKSDERRIIDSHTAIDARQFRSETFVTLSTPSPALVPSAPAVSVAAPTRAGIREASRPAAAVESPEAPVPAIHVSIGRVEVRASSSAQPSRSQPAATPSGMTLNEYLRQRAGAAR